MYLDWLCWFSQIIIGIPNQRWVNNVDVQGVYCVEGNPVAGDFLCLGAATLYAVSNVGQEMVIKHTNNRTQWLATIGVCGTLISVIQLYAPVMC